MIVDRIVRVLELPLVVHDELQRDNVPALDAIVVLGAPLGPRDQLTPPLAERARAAAALYALGGAPIVVATGGVTRTSSRAEADVLADAILAAGVPAEKVFVERESRTTSENARYTAALLARVSTSSARPSVWLVTQPFHGRRARRIFRRAGFGAHVWHIDDSLEYRDRRRAFRWVLREYAAWVVMFARR